MDNLISPRDIRWGDTLVTSDTEDTVWTALWDAALVASPTNPTDIYAVTVDVDRADGTTGTEVWEATTSVRYRIVEADPGGGRILVAA